VARVWSPPNADDLVSRYRAGESALKLGRDYGITGQTVINALERLGVEIRSQVEPAPADVVEAYLGGESVLALSRSSGISRSSLTRRLKAAGVRLRGVEHNGGNSHRARCRASLTAELHQSHAVPNEGALLALLRDRGFDPLPQRAVGSYNLDIAVLPVAVEVLGSDWHNSPRKRIHLRKRTEYLLDHGWNVIYVILRRSGHPSRQVTDQVVAFIERSRSDPSFHGEYRVIGSQGQASAAFGLDLD
jgi:very-short-patch-repair endonuclease